MQNEEVIPASEFCIHHSIELSFIQSLRDYDLIETVQVEERILIPISQLPRLEKIIRLHAELDINLEGIQTISHLLERMERMQKQIVQLTNRLRVYENYDATKNG